MKEIKIDNEEIGSILRYHRKKAGLSQLALSQLAGVGKTVVYDIEKGKRSIQFDTLYKILRSLNIQILFQSPLMDAYAKDNK